MPTPPFQTLPVSAFDPMYSKSLQGNSYIYDSGFFACPGAEITCCFIQNDHPTDNMVVWKFWSSYNGGDVTSIKTLKFRGRFGIGFPTANNAPVFLAATDGNNMIPAPATAFVTASPAGLTVPSPGFVAASYMVDKGFSAADAGGVIIPPGGSVGCSCEAEEVGVCSDQFLVSWVKPGQL